MEDTRNIKYILNQIKVNKEKIPSKKMDYFAEYSYEDRKIFRSENETPCNVIIIDESGPGKRFIRFRDFPSDKEAEESAREQVSEMEKTGYKNPKLEGLYKKLV